MSRACALSLILLGADPILAQDADQKPAYQPTEADEAHRTYLESLRQENRFPSAITCSQCHPDHYKEWSVSPHAYAMVSPVFNSMHAFVTDRTGGTNGDFCIRCHTPVGMEEEHNIYGSALLRSPSSMEGVTCISCHRVSGDYGTTSGRISITSGPLSDPIFGPLGNEELQSAISDPDLGLVTDDEERGKIVHGSSIKSPVLSRSGQCAMCHDVNSPSGMRLESAFTEFKNSPAAKEGTSCQDCHMSQTPGAVLPSDQRFAGDGRDLNYGFEPAARIRNSPDDPGEGISTRERKRTNHMFIGPDTSIVHPGIFPHSVDAPSLTYKARFNDALANEAEELVAYLKSLDGDADAARERGEKDDLRNAAAEARKHVYSDWLNFRWWEGWGTEEFEEDLSETARHRALDGTGFPWEDKDDPISAMYRRKAARLILARNFNLLNQAHVERTRILRRALQLGTLEVTRDDDRGLHFYVNVHNATSGHAVPTGFDAERVMYLEVSVTDANGNKIFQSGDRDPNGDLRDLHSAYVHASAPKDGQWLETTAWKERVGLQRTKQDLFWRPDPYLFSLQSKFVARTLAGGEKEQILAVNTSIDPNPFVRPPTRANVHTGRGGGVRKQFRTIPPLSFRKASYQIDNNQLSGARPYRFDIKLISQMVPVNLIKEISSVGFDMNLSAKEVAQRVAYGHQVDSDGTRKGGATTIWAKSFSTNEPSPGLNFDFTPSEGEIINVPVANYPFPHTPEEELKRRQTEFSSDPEVEDFMIQELGPLMPELWPGGVPDGLSLFPGSTRPKPRPDKPKPKPDKPTPDEENRE
ncbi:MAG: hypothetical protein HRU46_21215 [Verrucomicrobiales bacterium]|nr:hypothetical protein [Verrucomicrobiales bacterium]